MKNRRIIKHELIEVPIPAGTTLTEFQIPEQNNLREVELLGIQVHVNQITPYSAISQKPTLTYQVMQKCFITLLNYAGFAFLHIAPSLMFQTMRHTIGDVDTATETTGGTGGSPEEGGTGGTAESSSSSTFEDVIFDTDIKDFDRQKVNWPESKLNFSRSITSDIEVDSVVLISVYYYDPLRPNDSATKFSQMH